MSALPTPLVEGAAAAGGPQPPGRRERPRPVWLDCVRSGLLVLVAVLVVFAALIALFTDLSIPSALRTLVDGAVGGVDPASETVTRAIPLALVGVGAALALRAGVFNVGGEGQMIMGAVLATLVVRPFDSAPGLVVWVLGLGASLVGGAAWAVVPAVLWAKRGVSEILSTLLVNFATISLLTWLLTSTALQDPDPYVITAQGERLPDEQRFPVLLGDTRLHVGLVLAVVVTALAAWWLRTPAGVRVDLVGANPALAAQAGLRPQRARVRLLLVSAAVAGLAGAVQLFGLSHRLTTGLTGGVGYTGVLVAVLGRSKPWVTALAALAFAALVTGGEALEREGVARTVVYVVQGVAVVGVALATRRRLR